jgi:hypothetical protein
MKKYLIAVAILVLLGIVLFVFIPREEAGMRELELQGLESIYKDKVINIADNYAIADNRIFFVNGSYMGELYSMDLTGKKITKVSDEEIWDFKLKDKWIYFTNAKGFFKQKLDGSMLTVLSEDHISNMQIVNNEIYYIISKNKDEGIFSFETFNNICKMDLDGNANVQISEEMIRDFEVINDSIYYTLSSNPYLDVNAVIDVTKGPEELKLYKMALDGTNKELITVMEDDFINNYDDTIFYSRNKGFYSMSVKDKNSELKIMDSVPYLLFYADKSTVYYSKDRHSIYSLDLNSGAKERIIKVSDILTSVNVIGDWIFYNSYNKHLFGGSSDSVGVVNKDGSSGQLFIKEVTTGDLELLGY